MFNNIEISPSLSSLLTCVISLGKELLDSRDLFLGASSVLFRVVLITGDGRLRPGENHLDVWKRGKITLWYEKMIVPKDRM